MSEKQALSTPELPPPSYQEAVGYHRYGTTSGVSSHVAQDMTGYNTNYSTDYGGSQQTVLMRQPDSFSGSLNPVPDHMGLALFSTVLCCWPIGIFAIFRAQEARKALSRGDIPAAMMLSAQSKRFCIIALTCGSCLILCVVVFVTIVIENANDQFT